MLNVVYAPNRYAYTVNYYVGSISSENRIASQTREAQPYGTIVNLSADELNQQRPEGYSLLTQGRELAITEVEENNVVNVVFYPLDTPVQIPDDPGTVAPETPTTPQDPSNLAPETGSNPSQGGNNTGSTTTTTLDKPLVSPTATVPEAMYNATAVRDALNFVQDPLVSSDETTIEDDANPLASSPYAQKQVGGYVLLGLATLLALAALGVLFARKRAVAQLSALNGTAVPLVHARIRHLLKLALGFTAGALVMYLLWVVLLI